MESIFNRDFYPTPVEVIEKMLIGVDIGGKIILEPSAGSGNIVDYLNNRGAKKVIACETVEKLRRILGGKCDIIADDFLTVTSEQISHIDLIVMNPPFSADENISCTLTRLRPVVVRLSLYATVIPLMIDIRPAESSCVKSSKCTDLRNISEIALRRQSVRRGFMYPASICSSREQAKKNLRDIFLLPLMMSRRERACSTIISFEIW